MLKIIEKSFGRTIGVAVVDMANGQIPLGFETHNPSVIHCRMSGYGKFAVKVKSTDPFDIIVRQDNKLLVEKRMEAGVHTISRTNDGAPLTFSAPGTKPAHVADDAGKPVDGEAPAAPQRLFPDADPPEDAVLTESHNFVIVQVRFAHVKPDHGPELPPDGFSVLAYQLNTPKQQAQAMAGNFARVVRPEPPAEGTPDILDPENPDAKVPVLKRTCCMAHDREHLH